MRPIEILSSIQHQVLAEEFQLRPLVDPHNPGGDFALRDIESSARIQTTTVIPAEPGGQIHPEKPSIATDSVRRRRPPPERRSPAHGMNALPAAPRAPGKYGHVDIFA